MHAQATPWQGGVCVRVWGGVTRCRLGQARDSIGSWFTVLNILGFTAVLTNASMVRLIVFIE